MILFQISIGFLTLVNTEGLSKKTNRNQLIEKELFTYSVKKSMLTESAEIAKYLLQCLLQMGRLLNNSIPWFALCMVHTKQRLISDVKFSPFDEINALFLLRPYFVLQYVHFEVLIYLFYLSMRPQW